MVCITDPFQAGLKSGHTYLHFFFNHLYGTTNSIQQNYIRLDSQVKERSVTNLMAPWSTISGAL